MANKTPKTTLTNRGRWDATLRNIRALKARLTKLEARVKSLEVQMEGGPLPVFGRAKK